MGLHRLVAHTVAKLVGYVQRISHEVGLSQIKVRGASWMTAATARAELSVPPARAFLRRSSTWLSYLTATARKMSAPILRRGHESSFSAIQVRCAQSKTPK